MKLPCGLWQSEHTILPSRIGMCDERNICARRSLWHWKQVSGSNAVLS